MLLKPRVFTLPNHRKNIGKRIACEHLTPATFDKFDFTLTTYKQIAHKIGSTRDTPKFNCVIISCISVTKYRPRQVSKNSRLLNLNTLERPRDYLKTSHPVRAILHGKWLKGVALFTILWKLSSLSDELYRVLLAPHACTWRAHYIIVSNKHSHRHQPIWLPQYHTKFGEPSRSN